MQNLPKYESKFKSLNVDKNKSRYSAGKAPHKPVLLLSLIALNKNNHMDLNNIQINVDLREIWGEFWELLDYNRVGPIHLPLYHMQSDGFWNLDIKPEHQQSYPKSVKKLNEMVTRISLDEELIDLFNEPDSRNTLVNALLNGGYFSEDEAERLSKKIESIDQSFEYEEKIVSMVKDEFQMHDALAFPMPDEIARSSSFRRVILVNYNEKCAVCGMKIVASSGVSIIDAAHILPFSKFRIDDPRNGLALCKSHHWLFDHGLISVDTHNRTIVSGSLDIEMPKDIISQYHKEALILPEKASMFPSLTALEWHRENIFYK